MYEVAQAIAPGWERQRARIEESVTPVREWLIRGLAPEPGDTVLELASAPVIPASKPPRSSASTAA